MNYAPSKTQKRPYLYIGSRSEYIQRVTHDRHQKPANNQQPQQAERFTEYANKPIDVILKDDQVWMSFDNFESVRWWMRTDFFLDAMTAYQEELGIGFFPVQSFFK